MLLETELSKQNGHLLRKRNRLEPLAEQKRTYCYFRSLTLLNFDCGGRHGGAVRRVAVGRVTVLHARRRVEVGTGPVVGLEATQGRCGTPRRREGSVWWQRLVGVMVVVPEAVVEGGVVPERGVVRVEVIAPARCHGASTVEVVDRLVVARMVVDRKSVV